MKIPIIISISLITIALALGWAVFVKTEPTTPAQTPIVKNGNNVNTTPAPSVESTPSPSSSPDASSSPNNADEVWRVEIPANEINLQSSLKNFNVIIATKNKKHVSVYKKELKNNSSKILLEFDEFLNYDSSGNYWSGLPPSVALSPDKKLLVFADESGPKIYNMDKKETISLTTKIRDAIKENDLPDNTPEWSNPSIVYVYNFHAPKWSFDNKYISFKQSLYEGSSIGIFNVETKQYSKLEGFFGDNIKWSPTENFIIAAGESMGYNSPGLYSSVSISNFAKLEKRNIFDDRKFNLKEITFSHNGENIALIYNDYDDITGPVDKSYILSFTNKKFDKINIVSNDISTEKIFPFFSIDGNSVYYIENKKIIVKYDLQSRKKINMATLPNEINLQNSPIWTEEGYLSIIIDNRQMILDLDKHKIIYASSEYSYPITFAGFL